MSYTKGENLTMYTKSTNILTVDQNNIVNPLFVDDRM